MEFLREFSGFGWSFRIGGSSYFIVFSIKSLKLRVGNFVVFIFFFVEFLGDNIF